jgi:hypothetical protein
VAVDPFADPPQLAMVDQQAFAAMLVVAGGVSIDAFRRTLTDLREVVRIPRR